MARRRKLRFSNLIEVMPEVDRLPLSRHEWDRLHCIHCATI